MKFKVYRPRLLIAMLLLIGVLTTSAMLLAEGGDPVIKTRFIPSPVKPTKVPLTDEQKRDIVAITQESLVVESINSGQDWVVESIRRDGVDGYEAASLIVKWQEPVDGRGPWLIVTCGGKHLAVTMRDISNFTRLIIHVDLEDREILAYSVTADDDDQDFAYDSTALNYPFKVYDFKTGELRFDGKSSDWTLEKEDEHCPSLVHRKYN